MNTRFTQRQKQQSSPSPHSFVRFAFRIYARLLLLLSPSPVWHEFASSRPILSAGVLFAKFAVDVLKILPIWKTPDSVLTLNIKHKKPCYVHLRLLHHTSIIKRNIFASGFVVVVVVLLSFRFGFCSFLRCAQKTHDHFHFFWLSCDFLGCTAITFNLILIILLLIGSTQRFCDWFCHFKCILLISFEIVLTKPMKRRNDEKQNWRNRWK